MKHVNHRGSGLLLSILLIVAAVMLASTAGLVAPGAANTTMHRLVANPLVSWSLIVVLAVGVSLIRIGSEFVQATNALLLVGIVLGGALAIGLFWDGWLSSMLVFAALPLQRSALQTLNSLSVKHIEASAPHVEP